MKPVSCNSRKIRDAEAFHRKLDLERTARENSTLFSEEVQAVLDQTYSVREAAGLLNISMVEAVKHATHLVGHQFRISKDKVQRLKEEMSKQKESAA
ncbi:MAG: hypothetical protein A3I07_01370 [Candidatus Doudnabacteria bacterium RIFCSPLOWO2_02_FULL_42_9]|uniref:Uncharacterized protein n=1 Tax=Candidatus Doudnabacteria bacterium RIFCSPHIGHO2_01_FULL_41_86 TaxID=1817821 RepID=A0A1F5N8Q7_9BACT|nr:MAG: hypothetical protein A2717_00930 [Candidatus Doudnabacteria bacterium RIFCSPHIGHO2_01_FULL_41_86]OGE75407.1 MAG: hypothetical protein A3K07_01445 [Candidatus Doudnabacteria bacterium RIFCSPHIGHO2_01_43_10]OGE86567.1 MAG: hypothetical protein A3E28_04125 [Candidatus Doudnabacteria bacterium RIFCSPHIGHO2_12_FULL_42_22]OGE87467.1 MAG: hypothetical protein A3C49_03785 [Candidatus Doudnabacteria bacterium RIFCSPHIGHO2_02_FULL_42_25]OGE92798.1 MAG: hypothetical protein A2895_04730 [Candidatus